MGVIWRLKGGGGDERRGCLPTCLPVLFARLLLRLLKAVGYIGALTFQWLIGVLLNPFAAALSPTCFSACLPRQAYLFACVAIGFFATVALFPYVSPNLSPYPPTYLLATCD